MPVQDTRVIYLCEHCTDIELEFEDIKVCEWHEKECRHNPINKTCYTCKNAYAGLMLCSKGINIPCHGVNLQCESWEIKRNNGC
jgi:hypothetical protein